MLVVYAIMLALLIVLHGCATVCPSGWQATTTVGHSALWGQTLEQSITLSGDIGDECKPSK